MAETGGSGPKRLPSGDVGAHMCTRVLWNDSGRAVYVGRNMDWFEDMHTNLWSLPRGMDREGMTEVNPLRWTSRFGSLIATAYDAGTADGINEAGLAAHMLYLPETSVGERDPAVPGLSMSMWPQWYLDQCATVAEAVERTRQAPFQLRMAVYPANGKAATVHLALDDASGDSAIIECIGGEVRIFHDRRYLVMTNQPRFEQQLANLRRYRGFGGDERLPGTNEPADRFVRSAYYVTHLPTPDSEREAVAALMSVMRNVAAPFGISDPERPNVSTTIWRTIENLSDMVLYYDGVLSPHLFWVEGRRLDFAEGAATLRLLVDGNFSLTNDVTDRFEPTPMFRFLPAIEGWD